MTIRMNTLPRSKSMTTTPLPLSNLITDEYAHAFAHLDACDLVLCKCSIPADDNLQETLNPVRFDVAHHRLQRLPPSSLVSKHFATGLSPGAVHIFVEVAHKGERQSPCCSVYAGGSYMRT